MKIYHLTFLISGFFVFSLCSCKKKKVIEVAQRPNILFAISNDQSFPHAGAYGTAKGWEPGVTPDSNGVKQQLTDPAFDGYLNGNDYARKFEAFLDVNEEEKPFCLWYGSTEQHRAYDYKSGTEKSGKQLSEINKVPGFWADNNTERHDMLDYTFEIEYFGKHLTNMLALLEERGMLENTLVVVTSDNGMPFPCVKGHAYEYSNHLPVSMRWKNGVIINREA